MPLLGTSFLRLSISIANRRFGLWFSVFGLGLGYLALLLALLTLDQRPETKGQRPKAKDQSAIGNRKLEMVGARGETRTHDTGVAVRCLCRLATRAIKDEGRRRKDERQGTRRHADAGTPESHNKLCSASPRRPVTRLSSFRLYPSSLVLVWNGRRDSNSRIEFGRLACFPLHHFRRLREPGGQLALVVVG